MERLDKIRQYKYHEKCGFFCPLYGLLCFVIDKNNTPFSDSLNRIINDFGWSKYSKDNNYVVITNNTVNLYKDDNSFKRLLGRINRPTEVKLSIWRTIEERKLL